VEILLNCVWLVFGCSLITMWSAHLYRTRASEPNRVLPSRTVQFTALFILVILLFPVISVSDDIAMCTAPRDAEQALRLHDQTLPAQALLPSAMTWMDAVTVMVSSGSHRPVEEDAQLTVLLAGTRLPIESRPPPVAL
jgi:hypothetical protein